MAVMVVVKLEDTAGFHQSDNNYLDRRMDTDADADASTSTAVVAAAADDDDENKKDDADALMTTNAVAVVVQILKREDSRRNNVLDDTPTTTVEEEKETRILLRSVEDAVDYDSMQFVYCWHDCHCNYCIARRTNHHSRILIQVQPLLRFLRADE